MIIIIIIIIIITLFISGKLRDHPQLTETLIDIENKLFSDILENLQSTYLRK